MSDQAGSGAVTGFPQEGGHVSTVAHGGHGQAGEAFHGRTVSWVAVSIITIGFIVGGLGLVFGPTWWVFWVGGGLVAVGGLLALATNIFEDWY
jgi:hypothetical protein